MLNEYGEKLDRAGYAPSIIPDHETCYFCKKYGSLPEGVYKLDRHEIFHGNAYRHKSMALGIWLNLCHGHHMKLHQQWNEYDRELKEYGQRIAMDYYGWDIKEFRKRFGKNHL